MRRREAGRGDSSWTINEGQNQWGKGETGGFKRKGGMEWGNNREGSHRVLNEMDGIGKDGSAWQWESSTRTGTERR